MCDSLCDRLLYARSFIPTGFWLHIECSHSCAFLFGVRNSVASVFDAGLVSFIVGAVLHGYPASTMDSPQSLTDLDIFDVRPLRDRTSNCSIHHSSLSSDYLLRISAFNCINSRTYMCCSSVRCVIYFRNSRRYPCE